eukprot:361456-Chlamydomonas_euryale.AAC.6
MHVYATAAGGKCMRGTAWRHDESESESELQGADLQGYACVERSKTESESELQGAGPQGSRLC